MRSTRVGALALALALALAVSSLAGCSGGGTPAGTSTAAAPTAPTTPGPPAEAPAETAPGGPPAAPGPPPATAEIDGQVVALRGAGGCWSSEDGSTVACGEPAPLSCRDPRLPRLAVAVGTSVAFQFGFVPDRVLLTVTGRREELPAAARVTWRAPAAGGVLLVEARLAGRGLARYAACLDVAPAG